MAYYPIEFMPLATCDLVRVGSRFDGGYVIPRRIFNSTQSLLSFGMGNNWEFEKDFSRNSGARVVCFDHTTNWEFWIRCFFSGIYRGTCRLSLHRFLQGFCCVDYWNFFKRKKHTHVKMAIGYGNGSTISLIQALEIAKLDDPIFLKMDIEGWEYRILLELVELRHNFNGFVIEFHDIDLHTMRIINFINAISNEFQLVHFHGSSHRVIGPNNSCIYAEMTFMSKKLLVPNEKLLHFNLPIPGLDAPNYPDETEAVVHFSR